MDTVHELDHTLKVGDAICCAFQCRGVASETKHQDLYLNIYCEHDENSH